jgi:hypothetical protein
MDKMNKFLVIGVLSLAVMIPVTTWLAVRSQENRSNAAGETQKVITQREIVDGVCGDVNGTVVSSLPSVMDACAKGAVNWMDREALDGDYNWDCFGSIDRENVSCSAIKE